MKIFSYDDNKNIKIRSAIDGINIETLAKETMNIITEMYLTCENEFHKSVEFQEKIHKLKNLRNKILIKLFFFILINI